MKVRAARSDDFERLAALAAEIDDMHRAGLGERFRPPRDGPRSPQSLDDLLASSQAALFVAETEEGLLGYVYAYLLEAPGCQPHRCSAVVDTLLVTRRARRCGVGAKLMARVDQWARAQGAEALELMVYAFNEEALAFYRQLGFATLSRRMVKPMG